MTCDGEPYLGQKGGDRSCDLGERRWHGYDGEKGLDVRGNPTAPLRSTVGGARVSGASNEREW